MEKGRRDREVSRDLPRNPATTQLRDREPCRLERHLVVVFHLAARWSAGAGGLARIAAASGVAASLVIALLVEHLHVPCDDLGAVLLHPGFLVVPAIGADR